MGKAEPACMSAPPRCSGGDRAAAAWLCLWFAGKKANYNPGQQSGGDSGIISNPPARLCSAAVLQRTQQHRASRFSTLYCPLPTTLITHNCDLSSALCCCNWMNQSRAVILQGPAWTPTTQQIKSPWDLGWDLEAWILRFEADSGCTLACPVSGGYKTRRQWFCTLHTQSRYS